MTRNNSLYTNYIASQTGRKQWGKIRIVEQKLSGLRLHKSEKVGKNQVISGHIWLNLRIEISLKPLSSKHFLGAIALEAQEFGLTFFGFFYNFL